MPEKELWGGETAKAVDNFPVSGERGVAFVEYAGWEAIDAHERAHGEGQGRPRVKLSSWDALLARARELGSRS